MPVKELNCPKCGAPISPDHNICDYCKTHYIVEGESNAVLFADAIATDEHMNAYIWWLLKNREHALEVNSKDPLGWFSEEEYEKYAFLAREHLRKEGSSEPRLSQIHERLQKYLDSLFQRKWYERQRHLEDLHFIIENL